jgi:hypothetical protein
MVYKNIIKALNEKTTTAGARMFRRGPRLKKELKGVVTFGTDRKDIWAKK